MPSGNNGGGKVHRHDGMNREYKRSRKTGKDEGYRFIAHPGAGATAPPKAQAIINAGPYLMAGSNRPVANDSEVGDQTHIPEDQ